MEGHFERFQYSNFAFIFLFTLFYPLFHTIDLCIAYSRFVCMKKSFNWAEKQHIDKPKSFKLHCCLSMSYMFWIQYLFYSDFIVFSKKINKVKLEVNFSTHHKEFDHTTTKTICSEQSKKQHQLHPNKNKRTLANQFLNKRFAWLRL